MATPPRRFLVVPDTAWDAASLVSVVPFSGEIPQQAGRQVAQPERSATVPPAGDIGLTLTGEPEADVAGVARITRGGVVEDARWGWVRDGDDPATDLQLRQSPHVFGRRPDMIQQLINTVEAYTYHAVRPRLLPLISGDLLMVWTLRAWDPIWARDATAISPSAETIYYAVLDHTTDTWSAPAAGPVPFDLTGAAYFISALDVTQYPDTGEIIMCVATSQTMTPGSADPRILWVYQSTDDGTTWILKHRLHFDGDIPDIILDTDGDGDLDDTGPWQDWALELLDSGRLCLFGCTENYTWSLTSDDRGASWSATLVDTHAAASQYAGHGVGATKARNGMGCFMRGLRRTTGTSLSDVELWLSRDGQSWSTGILITSQFQSCDVTVCVSPDGWPHVYGTTHASQRSVIGAVVPQDFMWGRRLKTRDPVLSDLQADVMPSTPTLVATPAAFHCCGGTPLGSYALATGAEDIDPVVYHGFTGVDSVLYRGQVVLATVALRQGTQRATDFQAKMYAFGLMIYRANHWQPLQERVNNAYQEPAGTPTWVPSWPAIGRIYNETWDCYDKPDGWGYTLTGTAGTFVVGGAEGGYFKLVTSASNYWNNITGNGPIGHNGSVRIIVHIESGGSIASNNTSATLILSDGVDQTDVTIRFEDAGPNTKIALWDNNAAAQVGATIEIVGTGWIEVLYAQHTAGVRVAYLYARPYLRSTDPDWDEPYTMGADGDQITIAAGLQNSLAWGQFNTGDRESWWKGVHLARSYTGTTLDGALMPWGLTGGLSKDDDATNDRTVTGTGEPPLDNGLDNWMRSCRTLANPPMFMCRSTSARFRGEATTEGNWDYETGYAFAAANVQVQPVLREWRSVNDETIAYMVFRAPTGYTFRPDAVAVFGHNVSGIVFQFNTSDSWGAAPVSFGAGLPPFTTLDRYYHEWATDTTSSPANPLTASGNRVTVTGMSPWRPHQFKSDAGGQVHYVALNIDGTTTPQIFRIVDNTSNTLILQTDVDGTGITLEGSGAVFSDRYAVMIGHHFPTDPLTGYEYCQVSILMGKHWDADAAFARIGRIVLGCSVEISTPDMERGWSEGFETGSVIVEQPTGAAYSHRNRPILRTWQADRPWMMPPAESESVYASPAAIDARASWAQWLDTCRRIEGGGVACALVWEGDRFIGMTGEERVQCAADPLSLAMCHVTGLGELTNLAYDGRTVNLASGSTCAARPVAQIRALAFRETF